MFFFLIKDTLIKIYFISNHSCSNLIFSFSTKKKKKRYNCMLIYIWIILYDNDIITHFRNRTIALRFFPPFLQRRASLLKFQISRAINHESSTKPPRELPIIHAQINDNRANNSPPISDFSLHVTSLNLAKGKSREWDYNSR